MIRPLFRRRDGVVIGSSLALLIILAWMIDPHRPPSFDEAVLQWLAVHLHGPIGDALLQIYRISGVQVTGVLVLAALIYLVVRRWWRDLGLLVACSGGILVLVDLILKPLFNRARPPASLLDLEGHSFPSGHAAGAVAFYGAMVVILAWHQPRQRRPLLLAAIGWISLVWLSTLYARAHWPTDLLGGGCVGLIWLTLCLAYWRQPGVRGTPPQT